jgi:sigma-E factor negative regulatory protein RseB
MPASRRGSRRQGALVMSFLLMPLVAAAGEDPLAWLDRMDRAVEQLNYEGTLVHFTGSDTTQLRIVHRFRNGITSERITADGARREIIRNDQEVMCILPDQRIVLIETLDERNRTQSPLRGRLPGVERLRGEHYYLTFVGTESVAGHETRVIAIRPKDSFRYGYRISLDQATAMPLKTQSLDPDGSVPEQMLFSDIALHKDIPDSALRPSAPITTFTVRRSTAPLSVPVAGDGIDWMATQVPAGFEIEVRHVHSGPQHRQLHLVYSDGLATASLFIETAEAASGHVRGLSQMGAANAYTVVREGFMVTAVGEVPAATVEMLANSARPLGSDRGAGALPVLDTGR